MSEKEDVLVSTGNPNAHTLAAQARLQELRQSRALIPHFILPSSPKDNQKLMAVASVSPQFVEAGASAMANEKALQRAEVTPEEIRDLMAFADAYGPLADEYEAMGQFLRHSINAARNRAGSETLATYHTAKRLARIPRYAGLAAYVADMRRALGKARGKETPEQLEKRAATTAAKVAARKAVQTAQKAAPTPPAAPKPDDTTRTS